MEQHPNKGVIPSLLITHLETTHAFYKQLGFVMTGCAPDQSWAEFRRGDAVIQFYTAAPHGTPASPVCSGTFYIQLATADELASAVPEQLPVEWGPEDMPYGMREFAVKDPDGYLIAFTTPVAVTLPMKQ